MSESTVAGWAGPAHNLLAGRTVRPIGSADQPHSWTYLPDFAAALAAAALVPLPGPSRMGFVARAVVVEQLLAQVATTHGSPRSSAACATSNMLSIVPSALL